MVTTSSCPFFDTQLTTIHHTFMSLPYCDSSGRVISSAKKSLFEKSPFSCQKSTFSFQKSPISSQKSPTCEPYVRTYGLWAPDLSSKIDWWSPPPLLPLPPPLQGEAFYQKLLLIDYLSVYNTMLWPQMYAIYWYVYRSLLTEYRALLTAYRALLTECRARVPRMYAICWCETVLVFKIVALVLLIQGGEDP